MLRAIVLFELIISVVGPRHGESVSFQRLDGCRLVKPDRTLRDRRVIMDTPDVRPE
jgi:hypothetical protein